MQRSAEEDARMIIIDFKYSASDQPADQIIGRRSWRVELPGQVTDAQRLARDMQRFE
nr:hypothetical protein [Acidisoma sp. PAMC 29798]